MCSVLIEVLISYLYAEVNHYTLKSREVNSTNLVLFATIILYLII